MFRSHISLCYRELGVRKFPFSWKFQVLGAKDQILVLSGLNMSPILVSIICQTSMVFKYLVVYKPIIFGITKDKN